MAWYKAIDPEKANKRKKNEKRAIDNIPKYIVFNITLRNDLIVVITNMICMRRNRFVIINSIACIIKKPSRIPSSSSFLTVFNAIVLIKFTQIPL